MISGNSTVETELTGWKERSIAVQAICIPLNFLMLLVGILMAGDPTKPSLALRVIFVYFAAKTLQHQLPLSVGHVPIPPIGVSLFITIRKVDIGHSKRKVNIAFHL